MSNTERELFDFYMQEAFDNGLSYSEACEYSAECMDDSPSIPGEL